MNFLQKVKEKILGEDSIKSIWKTGWTSVKNLNEKSPLDLKELSLYLNKAIEKRAREVSKINFKIENKEGEELTNDKARSFLETLSRPNPVMAGTEFFRLYQLYRDLCGEAYIKIDSKSKAFKKGKEIKGLHLLIPSRVDVNRNDDGSVRSYSYKIKDGKEITYKADEVIRNYTPDPKNQLKPVSLIQAGVNTLETEVQLREYQKNILENGGRVEGVFKFNTKTGLTKKQIQELRDKYEEQYAGAERAGKPLFLGGDADYEKMALSPKELAYLDSMDATLNDICIMTEVPKAILANLIGTKYKNAEEARKIFLKHTIKPLLDDLVNNLNEFLVPEDMVLTYEGIVPEDKEEKRKDLEIAHKIDAMTTNEKREKLGLDPVEGGNQVLVPMNSVPLYQAEEGEDKKKEFKHPLDNEKYRRTYEKRAIKRMDRKELEFQRKLKKYWEGQKNRVLESLEVRKQFKIKGLADEIFNQKVEVKLAMSELGPLLRRFLKEEGEDTIDRMNYDFDFTMDAEIEGWLQERKETFAKQINKTTYKRIASEVKESIEGGESRSELVDRLEGSFNKMSRSRAKTVARTEVHSATNFGNFKGYKQTGTPSKVWVAVMDSNTRASHQMVDGEKVPTDMPFSNGLMYPGDPKGPPSETVNCRCVI